jgi:hypothetical protein
VKVTWKKSQFCLLLGNNIKTDHKEIEYEDIDCVQLAQDRGHWWFLLKTVLNLWVA